MNAVGDCSDEAPPNSFEPENQWSFTGDPEAFSVVTPLVGNLTDDDGNSQIDLCDVPDVVVVASTVSAEPGGVGHIYVLDGESGALHYQIAEPVDYSVTPAIGDIDGDGQMEIVSAWREETLAPWENGVLAAWENDGTLKWMGAAPVAGSTSLAIADMDNDGDVEIVGANWIADHEGNLLFTAPQTAGPYPATAIADLDGDQDQELVLGNAAYHHDGTPLWVSSLERGYPQIADLDGDPEPEVLLLNATGISVLEHDGAVKYQAKKPTGDSGGNLIWTRPATVHDFDGDDVSEFAVSSANNYTVYEPDASIVWKTPVSDQTGIAAGTAFDFLGDGTAEAMYADEVTMFIFDGTGSPVLQVPRTSVTLSEYPVVADIDNDGSAEIVVVSNEYGDLPPSPTVQVIHDYMDRWIQARRIWNQHTYHVTNVREDGTIPQFEVPSWTLLNTYRTNAQIEGGGVCKPDPEG